MGFLFLLSILFRGNMIVDVKNFPEEDEILAEDAFDEFVGRMVKVTLPNKDVAHGRLLRVDIVDDGKAVIFSVELPDELAPLFTYKHN
jgi:hypothetical protein